MEFVNKACELWKSNYWGKLVAMKGKCACHGYFYYEVDEENINGDDMER